MAYIDLNNNLPGILGPMAFRPETAKPLNELAEVLLRGPSSLGRGDRELIATFVSGLNGCEFCRESHKAFAEAQLDEPSMADVVTRAVSEGPGAFESDTRFNEKLKSLLWLAASVTLSQARYEKAAACEMARASGATDIEIHDTVLIAAAFNMYNRYVDGLGTTPMGSKEEYRNVAKHIVNNGYSMPNLPDSVG